MTTGAGRLAMLLVCALGGCSYLPRVPGPAPLPNYEAARIPGYGDIRSFGDVTPGELVEISQELIDQRQAAGPTGDEFSILALSGGGSDGAFGAGLLRGWSDHGDRPVFDLVTGISTGALIAPFAFLGRDYDPALERFYTDISTPQILEFTFFSALLGGPALADTAPLRRMLVDEITPALVADIAREHLRGRRLIVGTTNLDAQRPVYWDIGAIAKTGRPDAPQLIRDVLLASASIPGAFPPVYFEVEIDGRPYGELHVDGGVTRGIFVYPAQVNMDRIAAALGLPNAKKTFYLVRNAKLQPEYDPPEIGLLPIAFRSISTLIKSQTVGNLAEIEAIARRDGFEIKLAYVPDSFAIPSAEFFDQTYMRGLFDLGYRLASQGFPWDAGIYAETFDNPDIPAPAVATGEQVVDQPAD